jgi:hypothetical protein
MTSDEADLIVARQILVAAIEESNPQHWAARYPEEHRQPLADAWARTIERLRAAARNGEHDDDHA